LDRNPTTTGAANTILARAIGEVDQALHAYLWQKGSGRRPGCDEILKAMEPTEAAYIALATTFERIVEAPSNRKRAGRPPTIQHVSGAIARRLVEHQLRKQGTEEPALKKSLQAGALLIYILQDVGIVKIRTIRTGRGVKDQEILVEFTDEVVEQLALGNEQLSFPASWRLPMVMPPKDWTTAFDGGYLTDRRALVIQQWRVPRKQWKDWLKSHSTSSRMEDVYTAVNALQRTPWSICQEVLQAFDTLWENGGGKAGLPFRNSSAAPRGRNSSKVAAVVALRETVAVLKKEFTLNGPLYFPMELDWRGRVYSVAKRLEPQGADLAKGLLHFAKAKPLGSLDAVQWFMRHGANCFGQDKAPFDARENWVEKNSKQLAAAGTRPLDHVNFWGEEAEKPFQALAFCCEWAAFIQSDRSLGFASGLPVAMDGSCNGFQHLAALTRDPAAAKAVNLEPGPRPQDLYKRVLDEVIGQLTKLDDKPMAREWLKSGLLKRSLVKRPVMTVPYGVTTRGIADELMQAVDEAEARERFENLARAANFLATQILRSLGSVLDRANEVRDYLVRLASVIGGDREQLSWWIAPSGFEVFTDYRKLEKIEVRVPIERRPKIVYRIPVEHAEPDTRKQRSAIVANIIHSLDAAHLAMTVASAVKKRPGMAFATVHDSFATHAADADFLAKELREQFVAIYEELDLEDPYEKGPPNGRWLEEFHFRLSVFWIFSGDRNQLPDIPEPGDFDIRAVLDSPYFFS
jgi:DNA-directed RNA polymerase